MGIENLTSALGDWLERVRTDWPVLIVSVIILYLTYVGIRKERRRRALKDVALHTRVNRFDPGLVVGAYRVRSSEYLPIPEDAEITEALRSGTDVLITGRPGIGKSHAAVHALQLAVPHKHVLVPTASALAQFEPMVVRRRDYVVLLDDVDDYLRVCGSGGQQVLDDFLTQLRMHARSLQVVATLRNTAPELESLGADTKVVSRWRVVELPDWDDARGHELQRLTGVAWDLWDGTPLSLKQPSKEMSLRYQQASPAAQRLLRAMAMFRAVGLHPVAEPPLRALFRHEVIGGADQSFDQGLAEISRLGFLRDRTAPYRAYDAYLDIVSELPDSRKHHPVLLGVLESAACSQELCRFAAYLVDANDFALAEHAVTTLLANAPGWANAHYQLGRLRSRQQRWNQAASSFESAANLKPGWATSWIRLGNAYQHLKEPAKAQAAFDRARLLTKGRSDASVRLAVATILREDERIEEAIAAYQAALDQDDSLVEALYWKSRLLRKVGRWDEAIPLLRRAVELQPRSAQLHFGLADPLQRAGDFAGALEECRIALELYPDLRDAQVTAVHLLKVLGRNDDAEKAARNALKRFGKSALLWSYLGELLMETRRPQEAETAYRRSIQLDGSRWEPWVGLAGALRVQKKTEEAIEANKRALALAPECASAEFGLALCAISLRDTAQAIASFRRAIALQPQFPPARFYFGKTLITRRQFDEAIEELREARRQRYSERHVALELAKAYAFAGHDRDAIIELRRARAAGNDLVGIARHVAFQRLSADPEFRKVTDP